MITINQIPEFRKAIPIIERIEEAGYEAYFVGGGVRDTLLHLPISDVDIASSATPSEIQRIFPVTFDVGIQHGTVMVLYEKKTYEITTFRTESKYENFRRPEKVNYVRSLEEDLKRRDFTINAIAMDRFGNLEDPFDGQTDIEARLIRAVGNPIERFREDALRMMRAARFMSQLGFQVEEKTKEAVLDYHPLLSKIAVERIREEWTKLLIGRNRKGGIRFFVETRLFHMCPGFQNRDKELIDLALFPLQFQTPLTAWTLLVYFLGIPDDEVDGFLRGWKLANKQITNVRKAYHALKIRLDRFWDYALLYETGIKIALEVEEMITGFGMVNDFNHLLEMDKTLPIHRIQDMKINGQEVMHVLGFTRGGPYLGKILADIKDRILAQTLPNDKAQLKEFILKRRFIYLDEVYKKTVQVEGLHLMQETEDFDFPVLGTSALIEFVEDSCKEMMAGVVEEDKISIGTFISLQHSNPALLHRTIVVEVRVKALKEKTVTFSAVVKQDDTILAIGEHTRKVVDKQNFMK